MPVNSHIAQLIIKHLQETITTAETQILEQWMAADEKRRILFERFTNRDWVQREISAYAESDTRIKEKVFAEVSEMQHSFSERKRRWMRWASVAALLVVLIGGWYMWKGKSKPTVVTVQQTPVATVIPAGGNKATLTLADGTVIDLDKAGNGEIAKQGKTSVNKKEDGQLEYKSVTGKGLSTVTYNMLSTPRGGQYQLLLPDGSKVWLNAASSIKYPTTFNGGERRVEINGEAYFEVAPIIKESKDKVPFIVKTNEMEVEVLGTHFNINVYSDEDAFKTTLLEGKVKVRSLANNEVIMLLPGQQASLDKKNQQLGKFYDPNVDEAVAWRFGYFQFKKTELKTVFRQLERWYDVDVEFVGEIPKMNFSGKIPRNSNLADVLNTLQTNDVHIRIQNKRIIVSP